MRHIYKRLILILLDTALMVYVILAMFSFNKPDESKKVCSEVNIQIEEDSRQQPDVPPQYQDGGCQAATD